MFDFEAVAKQKLHYGHVAFLGGTEDEGTYRANREGFTQYQLRVRRLVDISRIDMSVSLLGSSAHAPIILCPCGALSAFHPGGEVEVARAVNTRGHIMTLSNAASQPIEDVAAARGGPVWFQLYRDPDWSRTLAMIRRAEAAGSPVLAWTVDGQGGGKRIVHARARRRDRAFCGTCHTLNPDDRGLALPGFLGSRINPDGKPMTTTPPLGPPRLDGRIVTWDYVKRLKDATSMKVVLKGIVTREDAELALEYGADGVWVSNHGGRMENSLRSTVECIPEVAAGVAGRVPDHRRRRLPPGDRHLQGAGARRDGRGRGRGTTLHLRPGRVRAGRRRDRAGHPGQRAADGHAPGGHHEPREDHEVVRAGSPGAPSLVRIKDYRDRCRLTGCRSTYVTDPGNHHVWILDREALEVVGDLGRLGHQAGQFYHLLVVAVDTKGSIHTGREPASRCRNGSAECSETSYDTRPALLQLYCQREYRRRRHVISTGGVWDARTNGGSDVAGVRWSGWWAPVCCWSEGRPRARSGSQAAGTGRRTAPSSTGTASPATTAACRPPVLSSTGRICRT